jgi:hypothetical protein
MSYCGEVCPRCHKITLLWELTLYCLYCTLLKLLAVTIEPAHLEEHLRASNGATGSQADMLSHDARTQQWQEADGGKSFVESIMGFKSLVLWACVFFSMKLFLHRCGPAISGYWWLSANPFIISSCRE